MRLLLLLLLSIPITLLSQTNQEKFITKLEEDGFLKSYETKKIDKENLLESLYQVYLSREGLQLGDMPYSEGMLPQKTKKIKLFLKHLREYDIINKEICKDLYHKIQMVDSLVKAEEFYFYSETETIVTSEIDILQYLYEFNLLKNNTELAAYLQELNNLGLLIDLSKIDVGTIKTNFDLVKHFKKCVVLEGNKLPESLEDAYRYAYEQIKALNIGLDFTDFKFNIETKREEEYDYEYQRAVVYFMYKGKEYKKENYYTEDETETWSSKVDRDFAEIFNVILTNEKSPYRLLSVLGLSGDDVAVVAVEKNAADFLEQKYFDDGYSTGFNYKYFNSQGYKVETNAGGIFDLLTQEQIEKHLKDFEKIGLLSHLSAAEKAEVKEKLKEFRIPSAESILFEIPRLYYYISWEMYEFEKPYVNITNSLAEITRGEFAPTKIEDDFNPNSDFCNYEFVLKGKKYQQKLEVKDGWYSKDFYELIVQAMQEKKFKGQFYKLSSDEYSTGIIYLTPKQYEYLLTNEIVKFYAEEG